MFRSVLKSIHSSYSNNDTETVKLDQDKTRKRVIVLEDQNIDILQTPPKKRAKDTGRGSHPFTLFNGLVTSAMNFTEKYNQSRFWDYVVGRLKKEPPKTVVTIDLEAEEKREENTKRSNEDKDVIYMGTKSKDIFITEDKPRSRFTEPRQIKVEKQSDVLKPSSLIDSIKARKPLQGNRKEKALYTSSKLFKPDDNAREFSPVFKIPDVLSFPQGDWKGKNYNVKNYEEIKERKQGSLPVYVRAPEIHKPPTENKAFQSNVDASQHLAISKHQGKIKIRRPKDSQRKAVYVRKQQSTANDVVRLAEKERYKQLLSHFTTFDIPSTNLCDKESTSNKENSVITSQIHDSSIFAVKMPKLHRRPPRSLEGSILSPRSSLLPSHQTIHHSTPLSPGSHPTMIKVMPSTTKAHSRSENAEDLELYSKPESVGLLSQSPKSTRTSQSLAKYDDLLSGSWTKKWREILSPENLQRERELAKIKREEKRLQLLKAKRKEQEVLAIEEVKERIQIEEESEEEEEEEVIFTPLTEEMEREVDRALSPGNSSETLADGFKISITRGDLATLSNLNWLNDEIINIYFSLIAERSKSKGYPNVHTFNSFFYPKLIKSGYTSLKRWTRKVDIFAMDILIVPIHLGMHWCLAVIDFRNKTIKYFDSLKGSNDQCLDALQNYLAQESVDKKKVTFDTTGWTLTCPKDIPEQLNGCDCGVFACKYAEFITRDAKFTFNQHHMPYFRRRMVYEILKTKLL